MNRSEDLQRVLKNGLVAIIRASSSERIVDIASALRDGGIDVIEVTCTVPNVLQILSQVRDKLGDEILLGAGTVLDSETARAVILAGAEFVVAPTVDPATIELCHRYDKLVMPGAMTPTEVLAAWQAGADVVKLFPADVGGPAYLKALHGPLPQIRLMATGGVNLDTLRSFMQSGASVVGLGGALIEKDAVERGDMKRIQQLASEYVELFQTVRRELATD